MAFTKVTNAGIGSTNTVLLHNLNVVGTVTATDGIFSGIGSFGGNVTIGGVLTYEDVTNVDSVGLITARNGITVLGAGVTIAAGGLNVNAGVSTFGGIVNIGGAAVSQTRDVNIASNGEANLAIETHNNATSESSNIRFYKSGNTAASPQVVETNDNISQLIAYGYDGTDYANAAASIKMSVDGAPGSNDMPGKITLSTNAGGTSVTDRLTIDSSGRLLIGTAANQNNTGALFQIAAESSTASISLNRYSADAHPPYSYFFKSRNASVSGQTIVQDGDTLGLLAFYGSDGTDRALGAEVCAQVDGTPGSNDMPSRLVFRTSADGSQSPSERMRITSGGQVIIGATSVSPANSYSNNLVVSEASGDCGISIHGNNSNSNYASLYFGDAGAASRAYLESTLGSNGNFTIGSNGTGAMRFNTNGSERARIDSSGQVLISHSTSHGDMYSKLQVCDTSSAGSIDLGRYTANAHPPYLNFFKSRSASINGNTIIQDGDKLGYITFSGNDGGGFHEACAIYGCIDGTPGDNDMPGKLVFKTVPDGSTTSAERMSIDRNGKILLGTTRSQYTNDYYDDITINNSGGSGATGGCGITMISDAASWGAIQFGDDNDDDVGYIKYNHNDDTMRFSAASADQQIIGGNVIDYFQHRTIQQIAGSQIAIGDGASKTFTITGLSYGWANVILGFYGEGHYCGVEVALGGLMAGGSTYYNSSIKMNVSSGNVTVSTTKNQTSYVITIANNVGNGGSIHGNSLFTGGGINSNHPAGAWS